MARQTIFAEGRYLGSREIPSFIKIPGFETRPQHSYVYFCMRCGEIWARFLLDPPGLHQFRVRPCRKHGDGTLSCPPAWVDDPLHFNPSWPDAAVRWEFDIEMSKAEKELTSHAT
ncbi:MAG TPA: hypothetical protein PKV98_07905 [Burkholderiaceae bacterium]|nr:hypothetical protein [Burkholderiaceae bacterium]